jgi:hypothetical protein
MEQKQAMCNGKNMICTQLQLMQEFAWSQTTASKCRFSNFAFDSNAPDVGDVQLEKQDLHITSTDAGISIVFKPISRERHLVGHGLCCPLQIRTETKHVWGMELSSS